MTNNRGKVESSNRQNDALVREPSQFDALTLGRLDVSASPDFTRRVMGRLGYMSVSRQRGRRDRLRRFANRAGMVLAMAIAIALAQRVYEGSDQVRRPASLTIPAAIGNDVRQQQHRFESMIRSIRSVVPAQPRVMPVIAPQSDAPEPQEFQGEFDQPQSLPFRWV